MIAQQMPLPEILNGLASSHTSIGIYGELWLANRLQQQGWRVDISHKWRRGDLKVFSRSGLSLCIEVKTARQGKDGCWRFTLYKMDKYGATDHRRTDYVVLLCVTKAAQVVPFVIPTSAIAHRRAIAISSNPRIYAGKLAIYRQSIRKLTFHKETIQ